MRDPGNDNSAGAGSQLAELRALIIGPERARIERLSGRLDDPEQFAKEVSQILGQAVRLSSRDRKLRSALEPLLEETLRVSVRRNPQILADALFPIIGAAVRKAVTSALHDMAETLNQLVEQAMSVRAVRWRIEALRTGKSYGEILLIRSLLYRVEQVFLIHRKTGLILQHRGVDAATSRNADLISGMLTAIQDFVHDSFDVERGAELETVHIGPFSLWVQCGPQAMLAGVVRGTPPGRLKKVFEEALEAICREQADVLENFTGDNEPFRAVRPYIDSCLLGSLEPEKKRGKGAVWILLGLMMVAGLTWSLLWYRNHLRWTAFVNALRAESGIVVTEARPVRERYVVSGLRDPLAGDPAPLAQRAGISPETISFHWKPYQSLEPPFVRRRLLEEHKKILQRVTIPFAINGAMLLPEARARVREVADPVLSASELAAQLGSPIRIEVIGHTDETGSVETNDRLARDRARVVTQALISFGVPETQLSPRPAESDRLGLPGVSFHVVPGR